MNKNKRYNFLEIFLKTTSTEVLVEEDSNEDTSLAEEEANNKSNIIRTITNARTRATVVLFGNCS